MPNNGYFDIKRDNELIAAGTHFWCETCLGARPLESQSPDYRYCQNCYDFLLQEVEMLKESRPLAIKIKPPNWIPRRQKAPTLIPHTGENLSTLKDEKITVDIIRPRTGKRGPKKKELPGDEIKQLNKEGIGAKAIASWLKRERGIKVSYKTIQRLLSGEKRETH